MVDTSIIMQAARTPNVNIPDILQRSAESAAAIEQAPLLTKQQQVRTQEMQRQQQVAEQQQQQQDALRKGGIIYNYAKQLRSLPMAQRRTFLNTIPEETIGDLGIDPATLQNMAIDDASIDTSIAQLEPLIQQGQQKRSARRSESLAGGRITVQELDDGTVRYLEYGQEIPEAEVRDRVAKANEEFTQDQQALSRGRRGGALGAELEAKPDIARAETQAKKQAGGEEARAQEVINAGVSASYALPTIKRTIDLLDEVETGGFNRVALRVKQAFGVEGADEGELSANLGKAVLSQLRDTFGAAFTQAEGERLERIEAGFGKNAETNKRLLKNILTLSERKIDSALKRAESRGDTETVEELRSNLEYRLSPSDPPSSEKPKRLKFNPETGLLE